MADWIPVFTLPNVLTKEPIEVEHVALVSPDDPRCVEIAKANKSFKKFIGSFIRRIADRGLIKCTRYIDPLTGRKKMVLLTSDLERFDAEFVTLFNLARPMRRQPSQLCAELTAQGILPAKETIGVGATFYRRSDLPFGN